MLTVGVALPSTWPRYDGQQTRTQLSLSPCREDRLVANSSLCLGHSCTGPSGQEFAVSSGRTLETAYCAPRPAVAGDNSF